MSATDDGTAPKTGGGNLDASAATAGSTRAGDVTCPAAGVSGSATGSATPGTTAAGGVYSAGGDGSWGSRACKWQKCREPTHTAL